MASISLADQLEDAIEMMIAEPDSAPPKVDLKIGELLGIAAKLRLLPDPEYKAALKAELLGQSHAVSFAASVSVRRELTKRAPARSDAELDEMMPTLFGSGDLPCPSRKFRDFSGDPRGAGCNRRHRRTLDDEANATHTAHVQRSADGHQSLRAAAGHR